MKSRNWITGSLVALLALVTSTARADHLVALQQEAATLDGYAHALCEEVRFSLRHAPNYAVIVAKVEALENRVHLFQDIVARPASQQQLAAQLNVIDRIGVSVADSVFDAARGRAWNHHVHLNTQRAEQLLRAFDDTVHHMEEHIDALRDCDFRAVQRPVFQQPVYQAPVYQQLRPTFPNHGDQGYGNQNWYQNQPNYHNQGFNNRYQPGNVVNPQGLSISPNGISINGRVISFGR